VVHCGLAAAALNAGVTSSGGVGVRVLTGITVLHALRRGELLLSPSLEAESSSLGDSSRMACSDGDSLRVMPPYYASEPTPTG
jgi:hypothetical protein